MTRIALFVASLLLWTSPAWALTVFGTSTTGASVGGTGATTLALPAMAVTAGQLVPVCFKWEGNTTLTGISDTAGNTYTLLTGQQHSSLEPSVRMGYVLSATAHAANIITGTFSGSSPYRRGGAMTFSYTGSMSTDGEAGSTEDNADVTPSSNTLTTAGTDGVLLGCHGDYTVQAFSNETLGNPAVARDGRLTQTDFDMWYKIPTATQTNGTSSLTRTSAERWVQRLAAFKTTGGGAGPPPPTTGTVYYVSLTGTNTSCAAAANILTPARNFAFAVACVTPGDTLYIRSGIWTEQLDLRNVAGTSSAYKTFAAYPGETPCLTNKSGQGNFPVYLYGATPAYLILKNLKLDGMCDGTSAGSLPDGGGWTIGNANPGGSPHHIIVDGVEISHWKGIGLQIAQGASFITVRNYKIHDLYTTFSGNDCSDTLFNSDGRWYAFYINSSNNVTIENGEIYAADGGGIQVYPGPNVGTIIRGNYIHNNLNCHNGGGFGGILVQGSNTDTQITHNLIINNGSDARSGTADGIVVNGPTTTRVLVAHNTVSGNGIGGSAGYGIRLNGNGTAPTGVTVVNNHSVGNFSGQLQNGGTSSVLTTNRTTGSITDCAVSTSNFTQKVGSSCIDQGTAISGFAYNGSNPDQGAFETFGLSSATVGLNFLDTSLQMNLNTPAIVITNTASAGCTGSNCGTPVVANLSKLTGTDSVLRSVLTGLGGAGVCEVGQTWTDTIPAASVTDSALIGGTLNQPMTAITAQATSNGCGGAAPPADPSTPWIYYKLDDGSGTNANDESANNLDGTLTNSPTFTTGKHGGAVAFADQSTSFIAVPYGSGVDPSSQSLTFCMGALPDAGLESQLRLIAGAPLGTDQRFYLGHTQGTWGMGIQSSPLASNPEFPVSAGWAYVCLVANSATDTATLYVNGVPGASTQSVKAYTTFTLSGNLELGSIPSVVYGGVTIDEVKLYKSALTAANILDLYLAWEPPPPPSTGTFSMSASQLNQATYQTGTENTTKTVVPLSGVSATTTTIHSGIPFAVDVQIDCTVANCDPAAVQIRYARTPLATGVKSAFLPVPDLMGPDQFAFYGTTADQTILNGALPATCLSGALTPTAGSTQQTASAVPVFDLPINGCIVQRYVLQMGASAVLGDIYWLEPYIQTGQALASITPAGGARITVTPVAVNSAPTGLHEVGAASNTNVQLIWTPIVDPNFQEYRVYQSSTAGVPGVLVSRITAISAAARHNSITDFHTVISQAGTYYYTISWVDTGGQESPVSAEVAVTRTGFVARTPRTP